MHGLLNTNTDMMKRLIVLLLALAGLAEHAARRSYPVRFAMLCILRRVEPYGRRAVVVRANYLGASPWLMSSEEAHYGRTPAAAFSLALCFRLFALALAKMSIQSQRFVHDASHPRRRRCFASPFIDWLPVSGLDVPVIDSS